MAYGTRSEQMQSRITDSQSEVVGDGEMEHYTATHRRIAKKCGKIFNIEDFIILIYLH